MASLLFHNSVDEIAYYPILWTFFVHFINFSCGSYHNFFVVFSFNAPIGQYGNLPATIDQDVNKEFYVIICDAKII